MRHNIKPSDKYLTLVIPAKAGIQRYYWIPDQVRHDGIRLFNRRVNIIPHPDICEEKLSGYDKETVFIVYCWSPGCNGADKAALIFSELRRPVKKMIGGIVYWEDKEHYPVEKG